MRMQGIFQGESKMAEIIRGKGVISGIAMGKIAAMIRAKRRIEGVEEGSDYLPA